MLLPLILALMTQAQIEPAPAAPPAQQIAPGVHLIPGAILPGRGPDGNTVVFEAPGGMAVVDTGRHAWHSDAILAFAAERRAPIAAIFNTHWHLDHSSGNGRIKAAHPGARLYTTNAVDRALSADGFLVRNLSGARAMLEGGAISAVQREEVQIFLDTMAESQVLRPDVIIERSGRQTIAGRQFDVRVAASAVSDADLWIYDEETRVAIIGDLVTLPMPFFETACPDGWRTALDAVWETPFEVVVPGHGAPMRRDEFNLYRNAFNDFIDCVASDAEAEVCAQAWPSSASGLLRTDDSRTAALQMARYYVGYLRDNGGKSPDCLTR